MKKFIVGIFFGFVLAFAVSAQAEEVKSLVGQVIQGSFPVTVNGEKIEHDGLVINGTSYLPVRTMANIFNLEVRFDADMGIELTEKQPVISEAPANVAPAATTTTEEPSPEYKLKVVERRIAEMKDRIVIEKTFAEEIPDEAKKAERMIYIQGLEQQLADLEAEKAKLTNP